MKLWVTRHALTTGIYDVEVAQLPKNGIVEVNCFATQHKTLYLVYGVECFSDRDKAIDKAQRMRDVKISMHRGQIERLKRMEFK